MISTLSLLVLPLVALLAIAAAFLAFAALVSKDYARHTSAHAAPLEMLWQALANDALPAHSRQSNWPRHRALPIGRLRRLKRYVWLTRANVHLLQHGAVSVRYAHRGYVRASLLRRTRRRVKSYVSV